MASSSLHFEAAWLVQPCIYRDGARRSCAPSLYKGNGGRVESFDGIYLPPKRANLCSKSSGGFYLLLGGKETPISALLFSALSAGEIMLFPMLLLPTFFFSHTLLHSFFFRRFVLKARARRGGKGGEEKKEG